MPRPIQTQDDLIASVAMVARHDYDHPDQKIVTRTIYTGLALDDMTASQRILFATALAHSANSVTDGANRAPGQEYTTNYAQTDYYWAHRSEDFIPLVHIIRNVAGRRR